MLPPSLPPDLTSSNLEVDLLTVCLASSVLNVAIVLAYIYIYIYLSMATIEVSQIYVFLDFIERSSWATPASLETFICGCLQKITKDRAAAFQVEDEYRLPCTWKV